MSFMGRFGFAVTPEFFSKHGAGIFLQDIEAHSEFAVFMR